MTPKSRGSSPATWKQDHTTVKGTKGRTALAPSLSRTTFQALPCSGIISHTQKVASAVLSTLPRYSPLTSQYHTIPSSIQEQPSVEPAGAGDQFIEIQVGLQSIQEAIWYKPSLVLLYMLSHLAHEVTLKISTYKHCEYTRGLRPWKNDNMKQEDLGDSLLLESRFEGGNLLCAFRNLQQMNTYTLFMQNDTNSYGYNQWFYYSIRNAQPGVVYTFRIVNFVHLS